MKSRSTLAVWILAVLAMAGTLVWKLNPLEDASARIGVPVGPAGADVRVVPLGDAESDFFSTAKVHRWLLRGGGPPVIATVVDGTRNRRAVHDPGFCFRGAGWTIEQEGPMGLPHGEARRVRLSRRGEIVEAVYWFSDGFRAHAEPRRYWWDATLRRLTLGKSGTEPVLIMLVPAGQAPPNWEDWLRLWPALTRY